MNITQQNLVAFIQKNSMLLQLPGPTTCFRSADYSQYQKFKLEDDTSSLIVLDWFTSGRMSRGERWEFANYKSGIDILIGDEEKLIFRDVVLLKNDESKQYNNNNNNNNILMNQLEPYDCFATLIIYGPKVIPLIDHILNEFNKIVINKTNKIIDLTWSVSSLCSREKEKENGVVIKIAGITTEMVKNFLIENALKGLDCIIDDDLFERAL
ncbi:hypothetical protein Glove_567g17 [Diversispora epigaea]|uniref:Uncharacterized protein n=1 Tax=Diversispora epigaea TaxID=1348612 RepID=A0A397G9T4_9GLOM|nr:hypothetical protein Glove_567g17 [Diversispora epigaea]